MTKGAIGIWIAIIVVLVVGVMLWRATTPVEAPTPSPTPTPALQDTSTIPPGLLLQTSPTIISSSPSPSSSIASSNAASVRISITDTGFSPTTVTVPAGTTVTFVNNGQASHWPASNPHPIHTALAGFDAKQGLPTGEEYSFTFAQKGTWGFHDHLFPQLKGQVFVQ